MRAEPGPTIQGFAAAIHSQVARDQYDNRHGQGRRNAYAEERNEEEHNAKEQLVIQEEAATHNKKVLAPVITEAGVTNQAVQRYVNAQLSGLHLLLPG